MTDLNSTTIRTPDDAGRETPGEPVAVDRGRAAADALRASFATTRSDASTSGPRSERPVVAAARGVRQARRWNGVAGARAVRAGISRSTVER